MYAYFPIEDNIKGAIESAIQPIERYGISIYVNSDPDWVGPNFIIDPKDEKGIEIFRQFCRQMSAHYKSLK